MISGKPAKILLIDSNVYFSKRLGDALKKEGFEVLSSTQPAFALTTLEYDAPTAVVCATNMREMGALEIAKIIHADPKNATLPIIALGDGSQRALMEAFQAGCEDYIDRQRPPAVIATHIRNIVISKAEGFQPTQMLAQADTSLSGNLTHHDLPGVLQMLGHAHQTGALHINAGATDAILFFDAGNITHAECGNLFGDEAVIHIIKSCVHGDKGVYKFVYGATSTKHTVLRNATDLMLDAMREYDESSRDSADDISLQAGSNDRAAGPKTDDDHASEGMGIHPPAIGGVTDRILEDLRSRRDNPVDQALADLLAGTNKSTEDGDDFNGDARDEEPSGETRDAEFSATDQHQDEFVTNSVESAPPPADSPASNDFSSDHHQSEEDHHPIADKEHS